jgi:hypothetical protein
LQSGKPIEKVATAIATTTSPSARRRSTASIIENLSVKTQSDRTLRIGSVRPSASRPRLASMANASARGRARLDEGVGQGCGIAVDICAIIASRSFGSSAGPFSDSGRSIN